MWGLGIIDCWDLEKNIELIENQVNKNIATYEEQIKWFENVKPIVEREKTEGKVDSDFVEIYYKTIEEAHEWRDNKESGHVYLPFVITNLKGNGLSDYCIVKKYLLGKKEQKIESNISNVLYQQYQ